METAEEDVVLDLSPLVDQSPPESAWSEARVEERLGPDAGRIVIMESDQLGTVQTVVELIRKLSIFLAIAILVLFALAVYLAEGPAAGDARNVGITFVIVGGLLLVIRNLAGDWIVDTLAERRVGTGAASNAWSSAPTCSPASPGPRSPTARSSSLQRARRARPFGRVAPAAVGADPPRPPRARLRDRRRAVPARRRLGPDARLPAALVDPHLCRVDRARRRGVPPAHGS